jgi:hypothetical protein
LSQKHLGEEYILEPTKLGNFSEKRLWMAKMRRLGLEHLNITKLVCNLEEDEIMRNSLMIKARCLIRLYMISAANLASKDIGSPSDPYLYIQCNDKIYNERNNY